MKGFFISLLGLLGRLAAIAVIGYFFFIYFKCKYIDKTDLIFLVENKQFLIISTVIIGAGTFFSLIDSLRKLFSIRFLKGLILLVITAGFVAAIWFMWTNVPY